MDERKNRQSWLDAGLRVLAAEGHEALRIMPIAEKLGVTKGSFYWHFKNLDEFHSALLEEWEKCHTQSVIEAVEEAGGEALQKLHRLAMKSVEANFKLGRAMRSWSLTHPGARGVVARVDKKRVDYLTNLLRETGRSKSEAEALGRWFYCMVIGYAILQGPKATPAQVSILVDTLAGT
jgi:AcrR family transcriptional regulator